MPPDEVSAESREWETIEELFEALESPLLSYALRLTGERSVAEDVVQEAFMKLHVQFAQVREPGRWLYRTVHNLAMNRRRDVARLAVLRAHSDESGSSDLSDLADDAPLPDEHLARREHIGLVRLSLENLDARSRELIRLKFNDELTYQQISERTGLKPGHVGYLLHHALKAVADELAKSGVLP